jgi:hypothetical protein
VSGLPKGLAVVGVVLLVALLALPFASARSGSATARQAKDCLAGIWYDEFGNEYSFKGKSSACEPSFAIKGRLTYAPTPTGLHGNISGSGMGTSVAFEVTPSTAASGAGDCPFVVHATVSGSPPAESASGTYSDLSPCSGGNVFYMTQSSA